MIASILDHPITWRDHLIGTGVGVALGVLLLPVRLWLDKRDRNRR